MLSQLDELDTSAGWVPFFQKINWIARENMSSQKIAKLPENRLFNRYRDVLPFDHSRVVLKDGETDYINANLVEVPSVDRRYILTQGPLKNTAVHFWQMVWEQKTQAIIMLNRVIEKNQIKCHQYWPCGAKVGHTDVLEFGNFRITYIEENMSEFFTVRTLEIFNMKEEEKRNVFHFHYLHWPDFGVPTSPATFLSFLFEARNAGVLSSDVGPSVIHCSAGIGRSGTYILVDSILKQVEQTQDLDAVDIKPAVLEMRRYRVGLIQTPDQLRFTYAAILEGTRLLMPQVYEEALEKFINERGLEEEGEVSEEDEVPPPVPARKRQEVDQSVDKEADIAPKRKRSLPEIPTESTSAAAETPKETNAAATSDTSKGVSYQGFQMPDNISSEGSDGEDEIIDLSASSSSSLEGKESEEDTERLRRTEEPAPERGDQRYTKESEEQDLRALTKISQETVEENIEMEKEEEMHAENEVQEDFEKLEPKITPEVKKVPLEREKESTVQRKEVASRIVEREEIHDKLEDKKEFEKAADETAKTEKMNAIRIQKSSVVNTKPAPEPMESESDIMESGHGAYARVTMAEKIEHSKDEPSNESIGGSIGTNPRKSESELQPKEQEFDKKATQVKLPADIPPPTRKESEAAELRRRQRQEKKEKTEKLVKDIKDRVKHEENTRWIRKIIRNSLIVIGVCAAAYIAYRCYRYFFRIPRRKFRLF